MEPRIKIIGGADARVSAYEATRRAAWKAEGLSDAECDARMARERERMAAQAERLRASGLTVEG